MLAHEVPALLVYTQLLTAGLTLQLSIQHLLVFRRTRTSYCLWMGIWSAAITLALCSNLWVFITSRPQAFAAIEERTVAEMLAFVLLIPTAAVFARRPIPRVALLLVCTLAITRAMLVVTTNLVLLHHTTPQGESLAGPLDGVFWVPIIGIGIACGIGIIRRWEDTVERLAFAVGLSISIALAIVAIVAVGPASELLSGYWLVPTIVVLQVVSSRRTAQGERREEEAIAALVEAEFRSRFALKSGGLGWFEYRCDTGAFSNSPEFLDLLGIEPDSAVDTQLGLLGAEESRAFVEQTLEEGNASAEYHVTREDGRATWLALTSVRVGEGGGKDERVIGVARDVTELKRTEELLRHRAYHDQLTGLPNRAALLSALGEATMAARPLELLLLDVDQFKDINDTLGHPVGDEVLTAVGMRLAGEMEGTGLFARLGGDEFAALVPVEPGDGLGTGAERAQRLLDAMRTPIELDGIAFSVRISIGIARSPEDGVDADTLLRRADAAMYRAKVEGGTWRRYEVADDEATSRRLRLSADLPAALAGSAIEVHYQPTVRVATNEVVCIEALARWRHPGFGFVSPTEFVPLAEQYGLGMALTRRVLGDALDEVGRWREGSLASTVAVNVSPRTLVAPGFVAMVDSVLAASGASADALVFEITEDAFADDSPGLRGVLQALRARGIRIAIDDFGTGYSSLSYLGRLPIDFIKLDRSFTLNIEGDLTARVIVCSTIELAHRLGLRVVAEGVETESTARSLGAYGCDVLQGYFISRPLPASDLLGWLQANARGRRVDTADRGTVQRLVAVEI